MKRKPLAPADHFRHLQFRVGREMRRVCENTASVPDAEGFIHAEPRRPAYREQCAACQAVLFEHVARKLYLRKRETRALLRSGMVPAPSTALTSSKR